MSKHTMLSNKVLTTNIVHRHCMQCNNFGPSVEVKIDVPGHEYEQVLCRTCAPADFATVVRYQIDEWLARGTKISHALLGSLEHDVV